MATSAAVTKHATPGEATSERAAAEEAIVTETQAALAAFLRAVRSDAENALGAPVLLAAARRPPAPFALGQVLGHWSRAVERIARTVTSRFHLGPADPFLAAMLTRLRNSEIPGAAYDSARAVLMVAVASGWSKAEIRRRMDSALSPKTPSVIHAVEGLEEEGVDWDTLARRLARTETTAAYNHAQLRRLAEDPEVHAKRWVAHHDSRTRPTHAAADGQTQPLDATFSVGGYALMVPGDPAAPLAETANCRCVVVAAEMPAKRAPAKRTTGKRAAAAAAAARPS